MKSGSYCIYKAKGAAQFTLISPKYNDKGYIEREGCVMVEVAPGNGDKDNPVWDWTKKISFALGIPDIAGMIDLNKDGRLVHDNNGVIKSFLLQEGDPDKYPGTFMLKVAEGKDKIITVPFSNGEQQVLMQLLKAALPLMLNWASDAIQDSKATK